jgi:amidohydrolase
MKDKKGLLSQALAIQDELVQDRRYLHEHPELSFQEFETSAFVEKRLTSLGYSVKSGLAKTGLTADIGKGKGSCVAIRADLDALPIEEPCDRTYRSKNHGVMHACGHDAHIACALGAAKLLAAEVKESVDHYGGRLRLLMQPAEESADDEGISGAPRMLEAGALEGVSNIIGMHVDSGLAVGKLGIAPGPVMASADQFVVTIEGKGGHGAFPEKCIDAVVIAAHVIQAIQTIVSRRIPAQEPAVITIGCIESSSTRCNIISDSVILRGTARSLNPIIRNKIREEIKNTCGLIESMGGTYNLYFEKGYPVTVNDPGITNIMREAAIDLIGEENVITLEAKLWAEDFSYYQELIPGCFIFVGAGQTDVPRIHHSANFDIDENSLYLGTAVLAETAKRLLHHLASAG